MKEKIKVIQIGTLHDHAIFAFEALHKLSDTFEILGYCEPDAAAAEKARSNPLYSEYPEIPENKIWDLNPDAIVIETYERDLTKYALMCAERKIHIHMDKPGGCELSDFEKLISAVKQNNIVFHTGYMYRYNPALEEAERLVKIGKLGEIYSIEAQMSCTHPKEKRDWLGTLPGGMMFYLGCHLIDIILRFQGKPKKIFPYNYSSNFLGAVGEDNTFCLFEYENGISFAKTTAIEPAGFNRRQIVICGTKGTYEIKPLEDYFDENEISKLCSHTTYAFSNDDGTFSWKNSDVSKETFGPFDRYVPMMTAFAEMVHGEKENPFSPDYELDLYKTILSACNVI